MSHQVFKLITLTTNNNIKSVKINIELLSSVYSVNFLALLTFLGKQAVLQEDSFGFFLCNRFYQQYNKELNVVMLLSKVSQFYSVKCLKDSGNTCRGGSFVKNRYSSWSTLNGKDLLHQEQLFHYRQEPILMQQNVTKAVYL